MNAPLLLVVVATLAYIAAHVGAEWLARRFLIVSGAEYLLLGLLLGPQISGLLSPALLRGFAPLVTLALGWMGALIGVRFFLPDLLATARVHYRIALVESLLTFLVVAASSAAGLALLEGGAPGEYWPVAVAMGAVAVSSTSRGIDLIADHSTVSMRMLEQLRVSSSLNAALAILAVGLLLSIDHVSAGLASRDLTATEWVVITLAIGIVGGTLFHLFISGEAHRDRLFISMGGGVTLISGAATYLGLSPLLSAFVFGAILVNTSSRREEIRAVLDRVERPFYFVLLFFCGASWIPSRRAWILLVVLYLAARAAAKIGGTRLAARLNGETALSGRAGYALLPQGGRAVAIALNYLYQSNARRPNLVFTAAIASALLSDLTSARIIRWVAAGTAERSPLGDP